MVIQKEKEKCKLLAHCKLHCRLRQGTWSRAEGADWSESTSSAMFIEGLRFQYVLVLVGSYLGTLSLLVGACSTDTSWRRA